MFLQVLAAITTILLVLLVPNVIYLISKTKKLESEIFWLKEDTKRIGAGWRLISLEERIQRIDAVYEYNKEIIERVANIFENKRKGGSCKWNKKS